VSDTTVRFETRNQQVTTATMSHDAAA